jgi:hypothetical protein
VDAPQEEQLSAVDEMGSHDEQALHEQLDQAREKLDGLVRALRGVDGELEGLTRERQRYQLLDQACSALEELSKLGAAGLFWDGRVAGHDGDDHVRFVRGHVDAFQKRLGEIEERRQEVLEEIQSQQESADLLADDLDELKRREEERKLEWLVEREIGPLPTRLTVMPWTRSGEDDSRFRRTLAALLLLSLLLGLLFPMIDLPLAEPWEAKEVPERLARLIQEELPPPPPVREETKPEEVEPEPDRPLVAEETAPKEQPKKTAESKGILAFREQFSSLSASKAPARLGSQARITSSAQAQSGRPTRNMVATLAPGSSGGINLASLSREVGGGGGQPEGVEVARVTSSIGGVAGEARPLSSGPGPGRTDEEIQIVFDRHKAALYRLYNRELRRDPTLKGQIVLRIRIEPDGSVSLCDLQSSDMKAPQLASQVVERVKTFDFGAKDVPAVTILYPIDFLPAV